MCLRKQVSVTAGANFSNLINLISSWKSHKESIKEFVTILHKTLSRTISDV